jgi:hypothetical protein
LAFVTADFSLQQKMLFLYEFVAHPKLSRLCAACSRIGDIASLQQLPFRFFNYRSACNQCGIVGPFLFLQVYCLPGVELWSYAVTSAILC